MSIHPPAHKTTPLQPPRLHSGGLSAPSSLGLLMVGLDNSILYTALPQLSQQLHTTDTQQLWIINAYALVLSGLLLGAGTLRSHRPPADVSHRLGRLRRRFPARRLFPSAWTLVLGRAFLGCGAAIMMPSSLALIRLTFPDEVERNTAIGIWGSVAVIGAAAGPTVGGFFWSTSGGARSFAQCPDCGRDHCADLVPCPAKRSEPLNTGTSLVPVFPYHSRQPSAVH